MAYDAEECTDDTLRFRGSYPWESGILDSTGMEQEAQSWEVVPSLDTIQQATEEVGDPSKVVAQIYFRQPFVIDEDSGLREAGALLPGYDETTDGALFEFGHGLTYEE